MMSYTSECTCLWSSAGMLMRRTSPSTRIIGGRPADRCRSDALFLTENASNSAISMRAPRHYVHTMTLDATTEVPVETMTPAPQYRHKFRGATPHPDRIPTC